MIKKLLLPILLFPSIVYAQALHPFKFGNVGNTVTVEVTPTIETTAYATGDVIGEELTLTDATRSIRGSGIVHGITLIDQDSEEASIDVVLFEGNPGGTYTDNAAADISDTDIDDIACIISITSYTGFADNSIAQTNGVNCPFELDTGNDLYAILISRGTPTYTAATDLILKVSILQD